MQRTIRLLLNTTPEQVIHLSETTRQFTEAFNAVCATGYHRSEKNGVRLHHLTYRALKERFPNLVSDLHIQARIKATEAIKSVFTRRQQGHKTSCPQSTLCPPRYNVHTFKVDWGNSTVNLASVVGRIIVPFVLPAYFTWGREGTVGTADLLLRKGRFWLHVVVDLPTPPVPPSAHVLGVDLGLAHPAVTSDGAFLGKRCWKAVEARLFRQKRQCQSKGTKSAKRRLRILRGRQARFRRDCDHILSRRIVDAAEPGGTVVLENLKGIRSRVKQRKGKESRRLHSWSFAQLKTFITYKAEAKGIRVELIDPRYTSQTCSNCNHQHRSNRRSQSEFRCRACGFTLHADLNAARNVRAKQLARLGTSLTGRPPSTGPTSPTAPCGGDNSTCKPSPEGDGR